MKYRLTAVIALAAIVSVPAMAFASTRDSDMSARVSEATILNGLVVGSEASDEIQNAMDAEHAYLNEVCPTVLAHPAAQPGSIDSFCQQWQG